jgi:peptidoglycan/LPS O-acetylase OafA/YrhL
MEYYLRRFFRIAPAYYFMLIILYIFFAAPANIWSHQGFVQTTSNLLFLQHLSPATVSNLNVNGALWTLTIEAILYLLLPLFVFLMSKSLKLTLLTLAVLGILFKFFAKEGVFNQFYFGLEDVAPNQSSFIQQQFPSWLPVFAMGMLIAVVTTGKKFKSFEKSFSIFILFPLLIPTLVVSQKISRSSDLSSWWFISYHLLIGLTLSVVVFTTAKFKDIAKDKFTSVGLYLGKRSYSIYLWHFPILLSIYGAGPQSSFVTAPSTNILIIGIPVILLVSEISYRLIELPLINYGKQYISSRKS